MPRAITASTIDYILNHPYARPAREAAAVGQTNRGRGVVSRRTNQTVTANEGTNQERVSWTERFAPTETLQEYASDDEPVDLDPEEAARIYREAYEPPTPNREISLVLGRLDDVQSNLPTRYAIHKRTLLACAKLLQREADARIRQVNALRRLLARADKDLYRANSLASEYRVALMVASRRD